MQISGKYSFGFLKINIYYFYPFFRVIDRDYTGRTLVNVLIFVNVTLSHQAHVAYFVLNDLTKVNKQNQKNVFSITTLWDNFIYKYYL